MVRTGALVLLVVTGAFAVAGLALAEPSLVLDPTSGLPGSTFVVVPFLDRSGPCQLDWNGTVLDSPTRCGPTAPDASPVTLTAPNDPGPHAVTLCVPTCAGPKILRDETFTVLSPAPSTTSPGGNVPPVSVPVSASATSTIRTTTPRPTAVPSSVVAGPVAAGSRVPPALVAAGVVLLALLALGATLALRRRHPVPRHAGPSGHAVVVSTSARRRVARSAPRRLDRGRVGVTSQRSRSARSQHEQRRQERSS